MRAEHAYSNDMKHQFKESLLEENEIPQVLKEMNRSISSKMNYGDPQFVILLVDLIKKAIEKDPENEDYITAFYQLTGSPQLTATNDLESTVQRSQQKRTALTQYIEECQNYLLENWDYLVTEECEFSDWNEPSDDWDYNFWYNDMDGSTHLWQYDRKKGEYIFSFYDQNQTNPQFQRYVEIFRGKEGPFIDYISYYIPPFPEKLQEIINRKKKPVQPVPTNEEQYPEEQEYYQEEEQHYYEEQEQYQEYQQEEYQEYYQEQEQYQEYQQEEYQEYYQEQEYNEEYYQEEEQYYEEPPPPPPPVNNKPVSLQDQIRSGIALKKVQPPKDNIQQKAAAGGDLTSMLKNAMNIRRNDIEMSDDEEDEEDSDEWSD